MYRQCVILFVIVCVGLLSGCVSLQIKQRIEQLPEGATHDEIEKLLGKPSEQRRSEDCEILLYKSFLSRKTNLLLLKDDKLANRGSFTGELGYLDLLYEFGAVSKDDYWHLREEIVQKEMLQQQMAMQYLTQIQQNRYQQEMLNNQQKQLFYESQNSVVRVGDSGNSMHCTPDGMGNYNCR